ncbi:hypothetical protein ACFLZM_01775 [Thermodesulfobacteriota bacterium]
MQQDGGNRTTPEKERKPGYFYGWNIVAAAFMTHLAYAEQFASILGLFFRPLRNEFDMLFKFLLMKEMAVDTAMCPLVMSSLQKE